MECLLSGNEIKCLHRSVACLTRIGHELLFEAFPEKLRLETINTAKSASLTVSFRAQFFDFYQVSGPVAKCRVLLKSVCSVFRTPPGSMGRLSISLPELDANKLQWTVECYNGLRKTYWISCQEDTTNQHVAVDRNSLPSYLVVRPKDLNRLLGNFQSSLQELTLIATEPSDTPSESGAVAETKAIELRSYTDLVKESTDGGALHTQLWIDPAEELQTYSHLGAAVDVTFSLKELKAFLAFCEGSEADLQLNFEKAGRPILLSPKLGMDTAHVDFDASLVLATMLSSQLRPEASQDQIGGNAAGDLRIALQGNGQRNTASNNISHRDASSTPGSGERSDHTAVWSELSGSGARTSTAGLRQHRRSHPQMAADGDATEDGHRTFNSHPDSARACEPANIPPKVIVHSSRRTQSLLQLNIPSQLDDGNMTPQNSTWTLRTNRLGTRVPRTKTNSAYGRLHRIRDMNMNNPMLRLQFH